MGLKLNSFGFGDASSGGGGGSVNSVTGLNTDNTDPSNPIVEISVDGSTITGSGTPASPLVANSNFVNSVTGLNTDNTDPLNPIVEISVDGSTITGSGTPASPLVANSNFVNSVTGLNTDNTDPLNPIVEISVDGSTITGSGTPTSPLVAIGGGSVNSVTGLNTDNTDPTNPIVEISVDGSTITGSGTPTSPLVALKQIADISYYINNAFTPTNGTTYFFGQQSSVGNNVSAAVAVPIPSGTITQVLTTAYVAGSFGTSENCILTLYTNTNSLTPTTDLLTTNFQFPSGNPRNFSQSFTGLSIPIIGGGSYIEFVTPTFATIPTGVLIRVTLIIEL